MLGIVLAAAIATAHSYYIGTAQYDITGPAAEINMVSLLMLCICSSYYTYKSKRLNFMGT